MFGGLGDDTYYVDNLGDRVKEQSAAGGIDLVISSVSFGLEPYAENLTLTGSANIWGTGNILDNVLIGNSGNNTITGGAGADTMTGGRGNDTYVYNNPGHISIERAVECTNEVQ